MARKDKPYLSLYVQDFMSDEKLRECSAESVGVYIFVMCVLHKSDTYGSMKIKDKYFCLDFAYTFAYDFASPCASMLVRHLPFSEEVIRNSLTELIKEGVLSIDTENNILYQKRMVNDGLLSETRAKAGSKGGKISKRLSKDVSKTKANSQANIQANTDIDIDNEIDNDIDISLPIKDLKDKEIRDIVEYLNEKAGTNYRYTSEKTKTLIRARMNEKYTVEDFYTVIDKKTDEWKNTEQEKYLRPETLFGTKFESYLNQKNGKPKSTFEILQAEYEKEVNNEQNRNHQITGSY
ncbi:MAG TPA: conserved phage C-terminal domain-containing protein [Petrotogaceae bacterium]|nr:conserved phage C-terminal domain-containing protein [Petrotogaceae bacterium]